MLRHKIIRHGKNAPIYQLILNVTQYVAAMSFNAASGDIRPEGKGRQALFARSSRMAPGWRWLLMLKGRRLIQVQKKTRGVRIRTTDVGIVGREDKTGPESALKVPRMVFGKTTVLKSLAVKR